MEIIVSFSSTHLKVRATFSADRLDGTDEIQRVADMIVRHQHIFELDTTVSGLQFLKLIEEKCDYHEQGLAIAKDLILRASPVKEYRCLVAYPHPENENETLTQDLSLKACDPEEFLQYVESKTKHDRSEMNVLSMTSFRTSPSTSIQLEHDIELQIREQAM